MTNTENHNNTTPATGKYHGYIVYLYSFDIAYEMISKRVEQVLGMKTTDYSMLPSKRSPRQMFFYSPTMVRLPEKEFSTSEGTISVSRTAKIFSIGSLSLQFRIPFNAESLEDLIRFHDLEIAGVPLEQEAVRLAGEIQQDIRNRCIQPATITETEAYTMFCIDHLPAEDDPTDAEQWLHKNSPALAGLLRQEEDLHRLAQQEIDETVRHRVSYFGSDLIVIDWDAALIVEGGEYLDDIVHIAELANVQLVELRTYDQMLDAALDQAYRDVGRWKLRPRKGVLLKLQEIHIDMARLMDELVNITKFFGDWHLARVYRSLSNRFHLAEWHHVLENKLGTLAILYQRLQQERTNLWMVVLETAIVVLFILDVILLLAGL